MLGSDQSTIRSKFGQPTETYQLEGSRTRWIYSRQPLGHEVYAADFDADGKLVSVRQMLTEQEIERAAIGVWTKRDIQQNFGKPREPIQRFPRTNREVWSYRMYKDGRQPAHFLCYFDDSGILRETTIAVDKQGADSDPT